MRVLVTTDTVGGVWQYSLALARGLVQQHDCTVSLVCLGEPRAEDLQENGISAGVELFTLPPQLEWMRCGEGAIRSSVEEVGRLVEKWKPNVIHSNQHCFGLLSDVIPTVVVSHSDVLSWMAWQRFRLGSNRLDIVALRSAVQADPFLRRYAGLVATSLSRASAVVAPSRFVAGSLRRIFGKESSVIHNGLWPDGYAPEPKEAAAVVVGRLWDDAKNAAMAVRAAEGLPLRLTMVGPTSGPAGERVHLPLAENVRYVGTTTWAETREILSRARFYLATSTYEPFGLAVLEAALSGCAILANDIPSYRELWEGTALFCKLNDHAHMRDALVTLLQDSAEAQRRGEAARERAMQRFTADWMVEQYVRLYRLLHAGGQSSTML